MIVTLTPEHNVLPHYDNILNIQKNNHIINSILEFYPILAGGYPMSLLLAPRAWNNKLKIKSGYYSDYDVYFKNKENWESALNRIEDLYSNEIVNKIETSNAVTFKINEEDPILGKDVIHLQLIKKLTNPPKQILETFDFINCAVGYTPSDKKFYLHKNLFAYHNIRELEILKPWMLDKLTPDTISNVIIQIARFKKYCMRWEYTLGEKAFWKLIEVYKKYPDLYVKNNIVQYGGSYDQLEYIATANQLIWDAILPILKINSNWKAFDDPHGLLKIKDSPSWGEYSKNLDIDPIVVQENLIEEY